MKSLRLPIERVSITEAIRRLTLSSPFAVIEQPTNEDIREFLRHSNAQFAYDAARRLHLPKES